MTLGYMKNNNKRLLDVNCFACEQQTKYKVKFSDNFFPRRSFFGTIVAYRLTARRNIKFRKRIDKELRNLRISKGELWDQLFWGVELVSISRF